MASAITGALFSKKKPARSLLTRAGWQTAKDQSSAILEYLPCPRPGGQIDLTFGDQIAAIRDLEQPLRAPVVFAGTLKGAGTRPRHLIAVVLI